MQRRHFLGTLTAGALAGTLPAAQEKKPEVVPPPQLTRTPLVLMAPRSDGFEAVWAVTQLCSGRLEWEAADGSRGEMACNEFGFVPQSKSVLRARVTGLKPATSYKVRAITLSADDDRREVSAWKTFRTLDARGDRTQFVVWNDTHANTATLQKLHAVTPPADFLLWNGDTCNDWKTEDILIPTLLYPGERDITEGRPLLLTWGNHDVRGRHAFEMPGIVATPAGRPYYAFRSGPAAVICLHTGEDKPDNHPSFRGRVAFDALRREQAAWLAETIQRPDLRSAPYRIVFCHIPLRWRDESAQDYANKGFDRHSGRSRAAWHDSLVKWQTQLVISGHTHQPAWLPATSEFPYGQLIGGGPSLPAATWMQATANAQQFQIRVHDLAGKALHEVTLRPLA